jgi:hypothetical protein
MVRCVAKKNNGTQCKCNAVCGSQFCGTHQEWSDVMSYNFSGFVEDEWTTSNTRSNVATPKVKVKHIDDLFDILGR